MKKSICLLLLWPWLSVRAQETTLPATEATYRGGLPHFFKKIKEGQRVRVAYLGGSITRADQGWRDQTFQALQTRYPSAQWVQIMAAIGGTGSDFGAYRLQTHVLQHQPDLVFVEFAVNDNGKSADEVKQSMEGIVRQIWQHSPTTDICFVYTFSRPQLDFYQQGRFPVSASAMETVASHYQIPSVCMALPAVQLISNGRMIMQGKKAEHPDTLVFSPDGVHPFAETGHVIYAETVMRHLKALESVGGVQKHSLSKPLMPHNLEKATMQSVEEATPSAGWQRVDSVVTGKPFASLISSVYATEDTTASIQISFEGTSFGLVDIMGPSSGQLAVYIDNQPPQYIDRFDAYSTYYRLSYTLINGLPAGKHTARIKLSPAKLDKAAILQKRNNTISNPALYEKQAAYIGALLWRK